MNKKKIIFIINPISGIGRQKHIQDMILNHLDHNLFKYSIVYSEYAGHASELSCKAVNNYDLIVAVGGDGTINEVAKPLINTRSILGIIPAGSGNGLAHHLKIPVNIIKAIKIINSYNIKPIDTVNINKKVYLSIAGIGFDALVAKKFAKDGRRGFWTYFKLVIKEYPNYKPRKYTIKINGQTIKKKVLFISLANSDQFGFNTSIAPTAKIDDGLIDVCLVEKIPFIKAARFAHLLFTKKIDRYIEIIKAEEVTIKRKNNKIINLDGEAIKIKKKLKVKVNHLSLNILTPK